jgi:signal transduction histidine kinase
MQCPQFQFDFAPKEKKKLNELFDGEGFYSYFSIPKSEKYMLRISYPKKKVSEDLAQIRKILWIKFIIATFLLLAISFFFTLYSLKPIRKALRLNDEFIKDILHDFNTPITAMMLNLNMFKKDRGEDPFINKVSHSVDTIVMLQNNLKSFLHHSPTQNRELDIAALTKKRVDFIRNLYPKVDFYFKQKEPLSKYTNEELLIRILDNLLSNAAKYNKPGGSVTVTLTQTHLIVQDTGKGIENPQKVLQRYYKEQERGLGLGLHIVQKLCNELNINLEIQSTKGKGTIVILDFSAVPGAES